MFSIALFKYTAYLKEFLILRPKDEFPLMKVTIGLFRNHFEKPCIKAYRDPKAIKRSIPFLQAIQIHHRGNTERTSNLTIKPSVVLNGKYITWLWKRECLI
jgi:hypothetical protein